VSGLGQDGQRRTDDGHHDLHGDHEPSAVEDVGENSTDQAEQEVGQHVCHLDERNEERRLSAMDEQPLRADRLHPQAHVAREDREPKRPEGAVSQRQPRRAVVPRHGGI
jgi:hypothetical protein